MHEYEGLNESDDYTFKLRKKISKCSHIIELVEEFQLNDCKYYIEEWVEMDMLKLAMSRDKHIIPLPQALEFIARITEVVEELHSHKLVYRNLRP